MRKTLLSTAAAAILALSMAAGSAAQALPGQGWYTTTTIQNIGTQASDVTLDVYPQGTGNPSTATVRINQGGNQIFIPGTGGTTIPGVFDVAPSLGAGFSGSAVASATEPIVAIGQIGNNSIPGISGLGVSGGNANEFFRGASTSAATLIFPAVKNNFLGQTTIFSIQAAGGDVAYQATIRTASGATHTFNGTIGANRAVNLIPSQFTPPMPSDCGTTGDDADANKSRCFGALTVTATSGQMVGTVVEYVNGVSPAQRVQAASLFPSTEASNTIFCPTIKNNFTPIQNRTTGLTVANTSNADVRVNVIFTAAPGGAAPGTEYPVNNVLVPAGGSYAFSPFLNNMGGMPANTLASARVSTADGSNSVVGIVAERNFSAAGVQVKATLYNCFSGSAPTSRVAAPLVKKQVAGVNSGLTVQNVAAAGTSPFAVQAAYVCGTSAPVNVTSPSLAPGASYTFFATAADLANVPSGVNCAVTLTGSGPIVAISQETSDFAPAPFNRNLNTKNYEGFNLP